MTDDERRDAIKRYHLQKGTLENGYTAVQEDATGSWVRYSDVAALIAAAQAAAKAAWLNNFGLPPQSEAYAVLCNLFDLDVLR